MIVHAVTSLLSWLPFFGKKGAPGLSAWPLAANADQTLLGGKKVSEPSRFECGHRVVAAVTHQRPGQAHRSGGSDVRAVRTKPRLDFCLLSVRLQTPLDQTQTRQRASGQSHVPGRWHCAFPGIDADQSAIGTADDPLAEGAHGRDSRARSEFDDDRAVAFLQPSVQGLTLCVLALMEPTPVTEHQDVGPGQPAATRASGWRVEQQTVHVVDFRMEVINRPDVVAAGLQALKMVNGAVAFVDGAIGEPCSLELAVHIAGEDRPPIGFGLTQGLEDVEPRMGLGVSVKLQAVAIKAPGQFWVVLESRRVGNAGEFQSGLGQRGICLPETFVATEVRQAGVHAHARTDGDDDRIGRVDQFSRMRDVGGIWQVGKRHVSKGCGWVQFGAIILHVGGPRWPIQTKARGA